MTSSPTACGHLAGAGVAPGDRVGLQAKHPEFLVAYFGVLKAGAVVVPMNVLLKAPEIAFHSASRPGSLMASASWPSAAGGRRGSVERLYVVGTEAGPVEWPTRPAGRCDRRPVRNCWPATRPPASREPQPGGHGRDPLHVGDDRDPKGAELTHFALYMNADIPGRLFEFSADDVVLVALPLFHVFGLSRIMNTCVRSAGP